MRSNLRSLALNLRDLVCEEGKPRMLVVDSRRTVRERIGRQLDGLGCATVEVRTPLEAINVLEAARPSVHALVIGPSLTQTRADELASFVSEVYPDLPVVIVEDGPTDTPRTLAEHVSRAARYVRDSCALRPGATAC